MNCGALIVDYRTPNETLRCIERLPSHLPVVVVNNDPKGVSRNQEAWEAIGRRAKVLQPSRNLGLSGALNLGYRYVNGDVLVLNPDVTFGNSNDVMALHRLLVEHDRTGIIAPRLTYDTGEDQSSARTFPTLLSMVSRRTVLGKLPWGQSICRKHLSTIDIDDDLISADWVLGAAMWIRRSALEEVGGFDEGFFLYNEDIDFCARLRRRGWHVLQARNLVATHGYRRDSDKTLALWRPAVRSHFASMVRLTMKYPSCVMLGRPIAPKICSKPCPDDRS